MATSYTAQVDQDVAQVKELMLLARNEGVERQVELMQTPVGAGGNLRVDTGFLRASLKAAVGHANFTVTFRPDGEAKYSFDLGEVSLVIAGAELEDAIEVVYTANYARPREYGARGQQGDRWVALSSQRWPQTMAGVVKDIRARRGG